MNMPVIDLSLDVRELIEKHFTGMYSGEIGVSSIKGGQTAAYKALASLDISGYANKRSEVLPKNRRGATVLSPYIRHNLLTLSEVFGAVKHTPFKDREKFRDELFWQEYARHLYARVGTRLFENLRFEANVVSPGDGWNRDMLCINEMVSELENDGWLVNQTRMWLASHWTIRSGKGWLHGQERMHRELLDGSRAANLLGWQWTVGSGTGKPYGFARWQVEKRAPELCRAGPLQKACPIESFPEDQTLKATEPDVLLTTDPTPESTTGPLAPVRTEKPERVLLTIESLGDDDPAMEANPELPVAFVFNEQALAKLQLSSKRLYFYLETLQDLASRRDLSVYLGNPFEFAESNRVAITHAPVPSFLKFQNLAEVHPYPWLRLPHAGSVRSFSAWRGKLR